MPLLGLADIEPTPAVDTITEETIPEQGFPEQGFIDIEVDDDLDVSSAAQTERAAVRLVRSGAEPASVSEALASEALIDIRIESAKIRRASVKGALSALDATRAQPIRYRQRLVWQ